MNVYRPVSTSMISSPFRPRHRKQLLDMLNWYDTIAGSVTLGILLLLVAPLARHYPLFALWPLAYALYLAAKVTVTRILQAHEWTHQPASDLLPRWLRRLPPDRIMSRLKPVSVSEALRVMHLLLAITLMFGALTFAISVTRAAAALGLPMRDRDTVWLLFAVPILRAARYGSREWIMIMTGLAIACNVIVHLMEVALPPAQFLRLVGVQSFWLVLICLLPAVLARYLAESRAGLNAAVSVGSEIARLRTTSQQEFASEAASIIAKRLGYDEVNILIPTSEDDAIGKGLRFLGAASPAGRELVATGYTLEHAQGITGWTAVHKHEHLINDVRHDHLRLYFPHEKFPDTRAEVTIPLMVGDELLGVLDVQSLQPFAFSDDDVETLRVIVPHLAVALDHAQNLTRARGLYDISQSIARRLLSHQELRSVLQDVVDVACEVLAADTVVLYPRNPRDDSIGEPVVAGELYTSVASAETIMTPNRNSAVTAGLKCGIAEFIHHPETGTPPTAPGSQASEHVPAFSDREKLRSTAVLPLHLGSVQSGDNAHSTMLGVIFINYRKGRLFTPEYKEWCTTLADLAALTIQNAWLYERVANEERANMWREIHDGMAQYSSFTRMLLEQLEVRYDCTSMLTPQDGAKLRLARTLSQELQRQVNYLIEIWRSGGGTNPQGDGVAFFAEVDRYADIVEQTLQVRCARVFEGPDRTIPPMVQHDARMILREAVHNATRHGRATAIRFSAGVTDGALRLSVADNGKGFDIPGAASARGLDNIRYRVSRRGGSITIRSAIGEGTEIAAVIPW